MARNKRKKASPEERQEAGPGPPPAESGTWAEEEAWARKMAKLEDELGPIVPGGAQGKTPAMLDAIRERKELDGSRIVRELRLDEVKPGMCILFEVAPGEDFEAVVQQLEDWAIEHEGVEVLVMREGVRFAGVEPA